MSLENLSQQISDHLNNQQLPPVDKWNPPYCGEMDIVIKPDGSWFYHGSEIKRLPLVKLFASVLKKEADDYFLVTPVEKVKITVEQEPFVITNWRWHSNGTMILTTNLGDEFLLDSEHLLTVSEGVISVIVRRNLSASIHRNVYYQWADLATQIIVDGRAALAFNSGEQQIVMGYLD